MSKQVIVVGSGNAALCAGIAALEAGAQVLMLEKADETLADEGEGVGLFEMELAAFRRLGGRIRYESA